VHPSSVAQVHRAHRQRIPETPSTQGAQQRRHGSTEIAARKDAESLLVQPGQHDPGTAAKVDYRFPFQTL